MQKSTGVYCIVYKLYVLKLNNFDYTVLGKDDFKNNGVKSFCLKEKYYNMQ